MIRVDIGLIVYNAEESLTRALDTLLNQSHDEIRIIISDDCSSDGTGKICKDYQARDSRIEYHRLDKNIGQIENFWKVLGHSKSKYFMWAAQDDYWEKDYIKLLLDMHLNHPECLLSCSWTRVFDPAYNKTKKYFQPKSNLFERPTWRFIYEQHKPCVNKYYGIYKAEVLRSMQDSVSAIYDYADNLVIDFVNLKGKTYVVPKYLFNYCEPIEKKRTSLDKSYKSQLNLFNANFNYKNYFLAVEKLLLQEKISFLNFFITFQIFKFYFFRNKIFNKIRNLWGLI